MNLESCEPGGEEDFQFLTRRHNSSSPVIRQVVFGSLGLFTLVIGVGFALLGAWPVAPFAGLECVALYLAYRWLRCHEQDFESITISGDRVIIEARQGRRVTRDEMNRYWAQVAIEGTPAAGSRLLLRSHGREVEIGKLLPDTAKWSVARRLRTRISGLV